MVIDVPIRVARIKFQATFLVLEVKDAYDMLLGKPWLRAAVTIHE